MTSTSSRRILSARSLQGPSASAGHPTSWRTSSASYKRPRSPDRDETRATSKRIRSVSISASQSTQRDIKKDKSTEREQQKLEFKEKYSKAFPNWSFYLDIENIAARECVQDVLIHRIEQLGGKVEDFFSRNITHLITDRPAPQLEETKENNPNPKLSHSKIHNKSPFKPKSKYVVGNQQFRCSNEVVFKAASYGIKIWNTTKLDSVLMRCLEVPSCFVAPQPKSAPAPTRQLERLLTKEKTHGPSDRDPLQKRHDYRYFNKASFFVLIEDLREEVATIAFHEYPPTKEQKGKVPWPILYCHPRARGPFIPFDDREKSRWERAQKAKAKSKAGAEPIDRKEVMLRRSKKQAQLHLENMGDLRRSVSLNNLHKRHAQDQELECDPEAPESANASGFLISGTGPGYMAASGNSVGVTSTTGTTSTASGSLLRNVHLPSAMDGLLKRQVLTSRKFPASSKERKPGNMDPPLVIPDRPVLRKSKSTNTLKLPKREEGTKPGYCESCRVKFEDFKTHVVSSKHRRFAQNDSNFVQLDAILDRIQRRPLSELAKAKSQQIIACRKRCTRMVMMVCEMRNGNNKRGLPCSS
ncbi:hypothetical protein FA15DRAFT_602403 [Coprinopsis marcescibilis]|uniref:DBF4-type domain-containing protein n=1 Tax=Coprinopsis marcescibilis TaxID=230819 RepID=A0A5C3KFL6_COPMA|nr:hypothetical protein FA15DRAFT_602403 [Coprinopsis marcescibilis]